MKRLLLLLVLISSNFVFGQTYTYTFEGTIDEEQLRMIEMKCIEFPQVKECKVKFKPEANKGEIFLILEKSEGGESVVQFSPIEIKKLLISLSLIPNEFNLIQH